MASPTSPRPRKRISSAPSARRSSRSGSSPTSRLSRAEFQQRLLGEHARVVLAQPATHGFVRRYAQLHNTGSTQEDPEGSRLDAVSILAFACVNDVEDYLVSGDHDAIEASEDALAGVGSEWWTAVNYSVINRLLPELVTAKLPA